MHDMNSDTTGSGPQHSGPGGVDAGRGPGGVDAGRESPRSRRWASTMSGYSGPVRLAHADSAARIDRPGDTHPGPPATEPLHRLAREEQEDVLLAPGATPRVGGRQPGPGGGAR